MDTYSKFSFTKEAFLVLHSLAFVQIPAEINKMPHATSQDTRATDVGRKLTARGMRPSTIARPVCSGSTALMKGRPRGTSACDDSKVGNLNVSAATATQSEETAELLCRRYGLTWRATDLMDRNKISHTKHNENHQGLEDYQIQLMRLEQKYQQMVLEARRSGK